MWLSRRALLGSVAAAPFVAACTALPSGGATATRQAPAVGSSGATSSPPKLPTYAPVQGPKPDLPGSADGLIEPAYFTYPRQLFKSVKSTPGRGGDVNLMTFTTQPPATPMDQNTAWQAINKDVGATLRMNAVPFADYATKFSTVITGTDLPDIFYVLGNGASIQGFWQFVESRCADLTPYLAGDAAKDYPNLANLPTPCWISSVFNGKLYGVPVPYVPFRFIQYVQQTLLDEAGVGYPKNADDFKSMLRALTKPQQGQYATGAENNNAGYLTEGYTTMNFRAPNNWRVDSNGKFTKDFETEEFRAALAYNADLYAAGLYSPSTPNYNNVSAKADFSARKFAVRVDGWQPSSLQYWNTGLTLSPPSVLRVLPPWAHDGGTPVFYLGAMSRSFSMLKKADPERIKELLRVLDWLAAPFGSTEYELQYYGVNGVDYTMDDDGNPQLTDRGKLDVAVPWQWVTQGPLFDFNPSAADYARVMQDAAKTFLPAGINDPSIGLYSTTLQTKGQFLQQQFNDAINDIFFGRRPLGDFDQLVKEWRSQGGDQVRAELEQGYAAAKA